jgi:glycine/D-amino acid oxidase-like deaminating enzyme
MTSSEVPLHSGNQWQATIEGPLVSRPSLQQDLSCEVAIVGAGFTGLWAAYYLTQLAPQLRIVVIDRRSVGFGASGRNGGWVSAGIAGSGPRYAQRSGWPAVREAAAQTRTAIDEIGRVLADEAIDCGFVKGGTFVAATSAPQQARLQAWYERERDHGLLAADEQLVNGTNLAAHARVTGVTMGFYTPHCARVHPLRMTRGLANVIEARGVTILESTAARTIEPHRVVTDHGTIAADVVLRATESYTPQLPGQRRRYLPLTSLMIGTEPVPAAVWDELQWPHGLTVSDRHHLFFYAQRTVDNRLAIGGRGAPYSLISPFDPNNETNDGVRQRLKETMNRAFPALAGTQVAHHWGGTLAVARDWCMSVHYDNHTGLGNAGGYAGHGVVAAHIAGRTLAELATGHRTERTGLPWVGHAGRSWEPEPLRFLASQTIVRFLGSADVFEDRTGRTARRTRLVKPFLPPAS